MKGFGDEFSFLAAGFVCSATTDDLKIV